MTEAYRYDAFGTLESIQSINEHGVLTKAETALSRFLYAGEQYDGVTELYYLRARQYDTIAGRFTQEDTYLGDGRNLYVYVSNNPLKYVDPSGHDKTLGYNKTPEYDVNARMNAPYIAMSNSAVVQTEEKPWYKQYWEKIKNDPSGNVRDFLDGVQNGITQSLTFGLGSYAESSSAIYPDAFYVGEAVGDVLASKTAEIASNVIIASSYKEKRGV